MIGLAATALLVTLAPARPARPAPPAPGITVSVEPATALVDQRVSVRVRGLAPAQEVTVAAVARDVDGGSWRSEAVFRADALGVADVTTQAPLRGSYTGVDPMGLVWSMTRRSARPGARRQTPLPGAPPADPAAPVFPRPFDGVQDVRFEMVRAGAVVASATVHLRWTGPHVIRTEVREPGFAGRLYEPPGTGHSAVLVVAGSDGGLPPGYAPLLAGHGYVALALPAVQAEGLRKQLVPLTPDAVRRALDWLRARPSVDPRRVAVLGLSRGAELALRAAAGDPQVRAVVALSPGPTADGAGATADIPVESIAGPVALVSCRSDPMASAAEAAARLVERLRAKAFRHKVESWTYDDCAHVLPDAWLPGPYGGGLGGTAEGNARTLAEYWHRVLTFLEEELARPLGAVPS
jgi:dienelactone hydrolase